MKNKTRSFFFAFLFLSSLLTAQNQSELPTSIRADGLAPDASAMLDVQSTTQGMLVPRMLTTEREMIASPATGLLVFDTDTGGFWFYDGAAWVNLSALRLIADADGDTQIQVEESADEDMIRIDIEGMEGVVIRKNNATGNRTMIELPDFNENSYIGQGAGMSDTSSIRNTFLGWHAGTNHREGDSNTYIGRRAGYLDTLGKHNIFIGGDAGALNSGSYNTYLGLGAGQQSTGSRNVFLGYFAGRDETGNNKLYIQNSSANSANALIYGEFDNDFVRINGTLEADSSFIESLEVNDAFIGKLEADSALIGNIAFSDQSVFQETSNHEGQGFLATPWLYSNAIEAQGERDENSTLITIGDDGTYGTDNEIHFVTNGTDRLIVKDNGRVGIGTNSPSSKLDINGSLKAISADLTSLSVTTSLSALIADVSTVMTAHTVSANLLVVSGATSANIANIDTLTVGGNLTVGNEIIEDLGTNSLGIDADVIPFGSGNWDVGNNVANESWDDVVADDFVTASDERTKRKVKNLNYGLAEILQLRPVTYQYLHEPDFAPHSPGLIAQEVLPIIPEVVKTHEIDADENGVLQQTPVDFMGINYVELVPLLIKGMQEQQLLIEELKKEKEEMKARMEKLEALLKK